LGFGISYLHARQVERCRIAAIYRKSLPGDVAGFVAGQKQDGLGHLFRPATASQLTAAAQLLDLPPLAGQIEDRFRHSGGNQPGADRVYPYTEPPPDRRLRSG